MKRVLSLLLVVALVLVIVAPNQTDAKQTDFSWKVSEKNYYPENYTGYRYPVIPGTESWPYGNHQDMIDACQITKEVCDGLSTEELLQTVLAYPLIGDMLAYDDWNIGYNAVKRRFMGLQELEKRSDVKELITAYVNNYQDEDNPVNAHITDSEKKRTAIAATEEDYIKSRHIITRIVLGILQVQMNISDTGKTQCDNDSSEHTFLRVEPVSFYRLSPAYHGMLLIGQNTITTLKNHSMTGYIYDAMEDWWLSDNTLATIQLQDLSYDACVAINTANYTDYGLIPIDSPSVKYNCHSYAWHARNNCYYWVTEFNTTGYSIRTMQNVAIDGNAVYCSSYGNGSGGVSGYTHSAVVQSKVYELPPNNSTVKTLYLKSKWGMSGLYQHFLENCPYYEIYQIPMTTPQPCDMVYYD